MPTTPRIGSLCSGYAGLDAAVQAVIGGTLTWVADPDPGATAILAHHHPDLPNLGDITTVDWATVPPVDVLCAGYPCQPFSVAGKRQGTDDDRHIWPYVAAAVASLKPPLIAFENVANHLNLGFDQVLRDLDWLGYDADWTVLTASAVGAPHKRARLFILGVRRESRIHRWPDRWGGDDRDRSDAGRHVRDQGRGGHDGRRHLDHSHAGEDVRRSDQPDEAGQRAVPAEAALGRGGRRGSGGPGVGAAASDPQAGAGEAGTHPSGPHHGLADGVGTLLLEPSASPRGGDSQAATERDEPAGRRSADPGTAAESPCCGGAPLGSLVGAARGSVRSGALQREAPVVGVDAGWPGVPGGTVSGNGGDLPWPAHAEGAGLEERREGRPARGDGGVVPDAARFGWGEGRPEPARLEGRPGVARGGGAAASDTAGNGHGHAGAPGVGGLPAAAVPGSASAAADSEDVGFSRGGQHGDGGPGLRTLVASVAADSDGELGDQRWDAASGEAPGGGASAVGCGCDRAPWGRYAAAVHRWEGVTGRAAPSPVDERGRLAPAFVEFLMGLAEGHVTAVPGLSRNAQLKALGNGVVPQQAEAALRLLLARVSASAAVA